MKPAYKMTLEELQDLRGSIQRAETPQQRAIYWLVCAIIAVVLKLPNPVMADAVRADDSLKEAANA
jgi:hypothetical protein